MRAKAGLVVALVLVCLFGWGSVVAAQTTPPAAQLLPADEVDRIAGGDWTSSCGYLGLAESPSIACTIIRNDQGDGIRSLSVQLDPMPPGMSVAEARQAWRPLVDAQVAPGVQTLHVVTDLGDEAYLITGAGAYADMTTLMFFAGGSTGYLQASTNVAVRGTGAVETGAVETGAVEPSPAIDTQLVQLAQVASARFQAQLGTAVAVATPVLGPSASPAVAVPTPTPAVAVPTPTAEPTPTAVVTPTPVEPLPPVAVPPAPPASGTGAAMVAPGPSDISLDPVVIATSVAAAAGIVLLIPFPAALFNSTVEENYDEIRGWFRFRRRRARPAEDVADATEDVADATGGETEAEAGGETEAEASSAVGSRNSVDRFWTTRLGIASFFAIAGILYGFLDPTFGFTLDSGLLFAGILIALVVSSAIAVAVVRRARVHLNGEGGRFRVLPGTLVVAVVCVLVTRITDFQPGYLYGVLAGLVFLAVIPESTTGREQAIKASAVAGAGVIAFLILGLVRSLEGSAGATGLWRPIDIALSALVVGGFEGLLFGMLPLTGLPGAQVKAWNMRIWALLLFLGAVGFLHIVVNPSSGYLVDSSRVPLMKVLALLVVFGGVSVGLWAWFRYRPMDRRRVRSTAPVTSDAVASADGAEATPDEPPEAPPESASD